MNKLTEADCCGFDMARTKQTLRPSSTGVLVGIDGLFPLVVKKRKRGAAEKADYHYTAPTLQPVPEADSCVNGAEDFVCCANATHVYTFGHGQLKSIAADGSVTIVAGVRDQYGHINGAAEAAHFSKDVSGAAYSLKFYGGPVVLVADGDRVRVVRNGVVSDMLNDEGLELEFDALTGIHCDDIIYPGARRGSQLILVKDSSCVKRITHSPNRHDINMSFSLQILAGSPEQAGFRSGNAAQTLLGEDDVRESRTTFATCQRGTGVFMTDCTNGALRFIRLLNEKDAEVWNVDLRGKLRNDIDNDYSDEIFAIANGSTGKDLLIAGRNHVWSCSNLFSPVEIFANGPANGDTRVDPPVRFVTGPRTLSVLAGLIVSCPTVPRIQPTSIASGLRTRGETYLIPKGRLLKIVNCQLVPPSELRTDLLQMTNPGLQHGEVIFVLDSGSGVQERLSMSSTLLCIRSLYFKNLLTSGMQEASAKEIRISDCSAKAFKTVINYILLDDLESDDLSNTLEVMIVADKYQLLRLKALCDCQLHQIPLELLRNFEEMVHDDGPEEMMRVVSLVQTFRAAELHSFAALRAVCQQALVKLIQLQDYFDSNSLDSFFVEIGSLHPALLLELFKSVAQTPRPRPDLHATELA